jgi:hypothetical protein
MDNKVYYGEYSLKHWIDLILKRNIILPDYQRCFVWNESRVHTLIQSFKNREFVPPVTIGAFKIDNTNQNLILDGQQRLTSILLAYLGLYPDEKTYKKTVEIFANENDDDDDEEDRKDIELDNIFEWTFRYLTEKGKKKQEILNGIQKGNYKERSYNIDNKFLETTFLGFSYLVPNILDNNKQQEYYSSVFRNINIQGKNLLPQESRRSFYFLDNNLAKLFEPNFCQEITISNRKLDFVRYLALLFQYRKDFKVSNVAKNYGRQMEEYYEKFIYSTIGKDTSSMFENFYRIFPNKQYQPTIDILQETINSLELKTFSSIIEVDMYFFGLVYEIVFKKKEIDNTRKNNLKKDLNLEIEKFKKDPSHAKTPSLLKHLRNRIITSLDIYSKYAK